MRFSQWLSVSVAFLGYFTDADPQIREPRAGGFSVKDALSILLKEELYELCAAYVDQPVYATTRTTVISSTVKRTETITPLTTTTETVKKGTAHSTAFTTVTTTVSSAYGTDTQYVYDFVIKTSHTTTTIPVTTIYTQTAHAKVRRALSTFPPPLPSFTCILSSACSSLLAAHTSYTTTSALATSTITHTAPTATITRLATRPITTILDTSTIVSTSTVPYLAYATTTTTFTDTTVLTSTRYLSTTRLPAQCAPTAYVINADEYIDDSINFTTAPTQPDALGCCKFCIATLNCQAWIFVGNPLISPPGECLLVTGTTEGACPAADLNSAFAPLCFGEDQNMFDIGLGACASEITLEANNCVLGPNQ